VLQAAAAGEAEARLRRGPNALVERHRNGGLEEAFCHDKTSRCVPVIVPTERAVANLYDLESLASLQTQAERMSAGSSMTRVL
jgi:hypothetical protein